MKSTRRAFLLVAVIAALAHCYVFRDFCVDDAAISYSYARSLAHGHGLVLVPGMERVEGYSNFLWVVLLALGIRFGLDVFLWSHLLGACFAASTVVGVAELCAAIRKQESLFDIVPSLLVASLTPIAYWSMSGLEGGLYAALTVWCAVRLVQESDEPNLAPFSALLAAGCALTRPDGLLTLAVASGLRLLHNRQLRALAVWYSLALLPVALHFAWRYGYYAYLLPNTFYAKVREPFRLRELFNRRSEGWRYVIDFGERYRLLPLLGCAGLMLWPGSRWQLRAGLLGLFAALVFFPIYSRGDWMSEGRFLVAAVAILSALAPAALLTVSARWHPAAPAVACLALLALTVPVSIRRTIDRRGHYPVPVEFVGQRGHYYHDVAAAHEVDQPSALDGDLGGTSFYAGMPIVDLGALADVTIARHKDHPTVLREYIFGERRPTFIRLLGFWMRDGAQEYPEFADHYMAALGPQDGLYIERRVFLQEGIDPRTPLQRFATGDLLGAKVGDTTTLYFLVRVPTDDVGLQLSGTRVSFAEPKSPSWRAGEILKFVMPTPTKAVFLCDRLGSTCISLPKGELGAQPVRLPDPPRDKSRGRLLFEQAQESMAHGDTHSAFSLSLQALREDPSLSFARRLVEEIRLKPHAPYRYRYQRRLDAAVRTFHLDPTIENLHLVSVLATAAGQPRTGELARLAIAADPASIRRPNDGIETTFDLDFEDSELHGLSCSGITVSEVKTNDFRRGASGLKLLSGSGHCVSPPLAAGVSEACLLFAGNSAAQFSAEPSGQVRNPTSIRHLHESCVPTRPGDRIAIRGSLHADDLACFRANVPTPCF